MDQGAAQLSSTLDGEELLALYTTGETRTRANSRQNAANAGSACPKAGNAAKELASGRETLAKKQKKPRAAV